MRGEVLPVLPKCHLKPCLLDFGCLWDVSQLLVQVEDFGVFLFHDSDEIVQQGDVPRREEQRGQGGSTLGSSLFRQWLNPSPSNELFEDFCKDAAAWGRGVGLSHAQLQGRAAWSLQARVGHRRNPGELA